MQGRGLRGMPSNQCFNTGLRNESFGCSLHGTFTTEQDFVSRSIPYLPLPPFCDLKGQLLPQRATRLC